MSLFARPNSDWYGVITAGWDTPGSDTKHAFWEIERHWLVLARQLHDAARSEPSQP
jgi:hypothetical protein